MFQGPKRRGERIRRMIINCTVSIMQHLIVSSRLSNTVENIALQAVSCRENAAVGGAENTRESVNHVAKVSASQNKK